MKKKNQSISIIAFLLVLCLLIYYFFPRPPCTLSSLEKRAVWFAYTDMSKFSYASKEAFRADFLGAIEDVEKYKTNTVIVHVRPFCDALYQSDLFPISKVITGKSSLSFDPLEEMIDIVHQRGLSIEAWVNPYRISLNQETYEQFLTYSPHNTWLANDQYVIGYASYQYILNPASEQVRDYIVAGITEIVENYDVDGIHFDDYFLLKEHIKKRQKNKEWIM